MLNKVIHKQIKIKTMKRVLYIIYILFFAVLGCKKQQDEPYDIDITLYSDYCWSYDYEAGENIKIPLQKIEGKYYIEFYSKDENRITEECISKGINLYNVGAISDWARYVAEGTEGPGANIFINLMAGFMEGSYEQCIEVLASVLYWSPFYATEKVAAYGEIKITSMFTVMFKSGTTLKQLEKLAKKNSVYMIGIYNLNSNRYVLACTNSSKGNALEMANLLYESGLFENTSPNTISGRVSDVE